jgi:hypothetical protein
MGPFLSREGRGKFVASFERLSSPLGGTSHRREVILPPYEARRKAEWG